MLNAANKLSKLSKPYRLNQVNRLFLFALSVAILLLTSSCGGEQKKRASAAQDLLDQANTAIEQQDYQRSMALLDSIHRTYPEAKEVRQKALATQPKTIEGLTLQQISEADSTIAYLQLELADLTPKMKLIDDPNFLENYWIDPKGQVKGLMGKQGIEGRVDSKYDFYLIGSMPGLKNIRQLKVIRDGSTNYVQTAEIPSGDERSLNNQAIFTAEDAKPIGEYIVNNPGGKYTIVFVGDGQKELKLTDDQAQAIANAYQFAIKSQQLESAMMQREKLERKLTIARNQVANTHE